MPFSSILIQPKNCSLTKENKERERERERERELERREREPTVGVAVAAALELTWSLRQTESRSGLQSRAYGLGYRAGERWLGSWLVKGWVRLSGVV